MYWIIVGVAILTGMIIFMWNEFWKEKKVQPSDIKPENKPEEKKEQQQK